LFGALSGRAGWRGIQACRFQRSTAVLRVPRLFAPGGGISPCPYHYWKGPSGGGWLWRRRAALYACSLRVKYFPSTTPLTCSSLLALVIVTVCERGTNVSPGRMALAVADLERRCSNGTLFIAGAGAARSSAVCVIRTYAAPAVLPSPCHAYLFFFAGEPTCGRRKREGGFTLTVLPGFFVAAWIA